MSTAPFAHAHGPGWHTPVPEDHPAASLLSAEAVRSHCTQVMSSVEQGGSQYFTWHPERLQATADYVVETMRQRYPDLAVPYHSRWRHFEAGGVDRWADLARRAHLEADPHERARIRIDLVIPSVLLDAGAGPDWRYLDEARGVALARSEGLGVASFNLFESGAFSAHGDERPLSSDAAALAHITPDVIAEGFQVGPDNPLVGLEGRVALLRRLGEVMHATPAVFGRPARLGHLLDFLLLHASGRRMTAPRPMSTSADPPRGYGPAWDRPGARPVEIEAGFVLATLLRALGPVWPGRIAQAGVSLGDCWRHPATSDGLVPFHKLTQWLTYSLLEPLEEAGLVVTGLGALTGLPEYRNGGLLLDLGLLAPRDPALMERPLTVDSLPVVEWRAVTVIALDRIAEVVRQQLMKSEAEFPLARVLEGGTWAAGRRIAAERRTGGMPPMQIESDGTVF